LRHLVALRIDDVLTILPIMQLFKSTIVALLAFVAYATAATHKPKSCQGEGNSCNANEPCCPGYKCDKEVSTDLELKCYNSQSVWQLVLYSPTTTCDLAIVTRNQRLRCESARLCGFILHQT